MNILIIAPHRDDELLGIGGTILKRKAAGDTVSVCVVTAKEGGDWGPLTIRTHEEMKRVFKLCIEYSIILKKIEVKRMISI